MASHARQPSLQWLPLWGSGPSKNAAVRHSIFRPLLEHQIGLRFCAICARSCPQLVYFQIGKRLLASCALLEPEATTAVTA